MIIRNSTNITKAEKKEVAEFIKKEMEGIESYNVDIFYSDIDGKFFVISTKDSMKYLKNIDNTYYNTFRHCGINGDLTLEQIEEAIF